MRQDQANTHHRRSSATCPCCREDKSSGSCCCAIVSFVHNRTVFLFASRLPLLLTLHVLLEDILPSRFYPREAVYMMLCSRKYETKHQRVTFTACTSLFPLRALWSSFTQPRPASVLLFNSFVPGKKQLAITRVSYTNRGQTSVTQSYRLLGKKSTDAWYLKDHNGEGLGAPPRTYQNKIAHARDRKGTVAHHHAFRLTTRRIAKFELCSPRAPKDCSQVSYTKYNKVQN